MATPEEYRQFADECFRWAAEAKTEDERKAFLGMARDWTQAALWLDGILITGGEACERSGSPVLS